MAILSNINGKFAVEDNGAIKFNNLTGTNNQVLIANTGASPTWVDVSTIIGGPYLPLTGGTLAGAGNLVVGGTLGVNGATTLNAALTGTTATFSNSVNCDTLLSVSYSDISTGENRGLRIINTSGTDQQWNITAGVTGSENESFCIRDATANVNALTMAISSGNAVFAGTVKTQNTSANAYPYFAIKASAKEYHIGVGGASAVAGYANNLYFYDNTDAAIRMVIDTSGKVGIGTATPNRPLTIQSNSGATALSIYARSNDDYGFIQFFGYNQTTLWSEIAGRPSNLSFYQNSNEVLRLGVSSSFFPSGNIGIGASLPGEKLEINGNIRIYNSSNAPYIDFVENGAVTDSKARITMDQIDGSNGTLLFATEGSGTLAERMSIKSNGQIQLQGSSSSLAKSTTQTQFAFIPGSTPGASLMPENPSGMSSASAGYHIVYGANNSSPYQAFIDVITYQCGSSTNVTVISSTTLNNSPGSRSYSKNSSAVFLNISGAANYNCNIKTTFINFPH